MGSWIKLPEKPENRLIRDKVKVSAIITTHKREPAILARALKSVLAQTWDNLEIIVVDDSPADYELRDAVAEKISELHDESGREIRYIRHETCRGACAARNTGFFNSTGEIIGYLDDDDEWLPQKTERMLAGFTSEEIALVYCDDILLNEKTGEKRTVIRKKHSGKVYKSLILSNYVGSTSFPLIRRAALESIGGFDEELQSAQDADVWLRISQKYEISFVAEPLVIYHQHEGEQITSNPEKKIAGMERVIKKNEKYINSNKKAYWVRHMKLIPFYMQAGYKDKAKQTWKECRKLWPENIKGNLKYWLLLRG